MGLVALTAALVIPSLAGPLGQVLQMVLPGIAACYMAAIGHRTASIAVSAVLALSVLLLLALGDIAGVMILFQSVLIAAGIYLSLLRRWSGTETWVVLSSGLSLLFLLFLLAGSGGDFTKALSEITGLVNQELDRGIQAVIANLEQQKPGPELMAIMESELQQFKETLIYYFPGIMGAGMVITALLNLWSFRYCRLKAMARFPRPEYTIYGILLPFASWRLPFWLVWIFIAGGILAAGTQGVWQRVGCNLVLSCCLFYLIQGFWVVRYFFHRLNVPWWIRGVVYLLIGIQWYGLLLVVLTGLLDTWMDFRTTLDRAKSSQDEQ